MTLRASSLSWSDRTDRIRNLASVPFSFVKYWCDRKRILRNKYAFPFTVDESSVTASYLMTFCLFFILNEYWKNNDDRTSLNCSQKKCMRIFFSWSICKGYPEVILKSMLFEHFFFLQKKNLPLWSIGYVNLKQLLVTIAVITGVCLSECYFTSLAWKWEKRKFYLKPSTSAKWDEWPAAIFKGLWIQLFAHAK